jgi:hypothetical protein
MRIFDNDYVINFLRDNGYPPSYNDGMLAWLRAYYGVTRGTLPDLMRKYIKDVGGDQLLIPTSGNIELLATIYSNPNPFYAAVITQQFLQVIQASLYTNTSVLYAPTVALAASGSSFLLMEDTFSILMEDGFLIELEAA